MPSTTLLTGANGTLGLALTSALLLQDPTQHLLLTVRNTSLSDTNTASLHRILSQHPNAQARIIQLDLSSLQAVRTFTEQIQHDITSGAVPRLSSIICNAFAWSLTGPKTSTDGYDAGFQVTHLSHFLLVLRLLGCMDSAEAKPKIVLLGSDAHDGTVKNSWPMSPIPARIPADIEELVKPVEIPPGREHDYGFTQYGNGKLANVMFMHDLNRRLLKSPDLAHIAAVAVNPGGLPTSRAFDTAGYSVRLFFAVLKMLVYVTRYFTNALRLPEDAARDVVAVASDPVFEGKRGYFDGVKEVRSSEPSYDEVLQDRLWTACVRWCRLDREETVLPL